MVVGGDVSVGSKDEGYRGEVSTKEKEDCEKSPCENASEGKGTGELSRRGMGTRIMSGATPTNFSLENQRELRIESQSLNNYLSDIVIMNCNRLFWMKDDFS